MSVTRWDPFQDLLSIQQEMNDLFGRAFGGVGDRGQRIQQLVS